MKNEAYFIDYQFLQTFERGQSPILQAGNLALKAFNSISGITISAIEDFFQMIESPEAYYRERYYQLNRKDFALLEKLNLNFADRINLPEDFQSVTEKVNRFKREFAERDSGLYTIEKGEIINSEKAIQRRDSKAYFIATTPEEKKRLAICEQMIQAFAEVENELKASLRANQFEPIQKNKPFARPLPYNLKFATDQRGGWELRPNPAYVINSFRGTNHLGFQWHTEKELQRAIKDGEKIEARSKSTFQRETIIGNSPNFTPSAEPFTVLNTPW